MQLFERKDIWFDSADGSHKTAGYIYQTKGKPLCVVQVSHGMREYTQRYSPLAAFFAENGVVLCGNDHLGHGNSVNTPADLGYFGGQGSGHFLLEDLKTMNQIVRDACPSVPVILLGHSMGSFFARQYACLWPETIDGLIISGTSGPNPGTYMGMLLAGLLSKLRGERHRSRFLSNIAFGSNLKRIKTPKTLSDWLSTDEKVVEAYLKDPGCNFSFTVSAFREMFASLHAVSKAKWAAKLNPNMPLLIVSGKEDPIGDYGKGIRILEGWLQQAGIKKMSTLLYSGGRHEMYNEVNKEQVYTDTMHFLREHWEDVNRS